MKPKPDSQGEQDQKPPRRYWCPLRPRIGISNWITIGLTAALVFVGASQILVYLQQAGIMHRQLGVMQSDATIHKNESIAKMDVSVDRLPMGHRWGIQATWKNIGKTDAREYWGWDDFKIFPSIKEVADFDLLVPSDPQKFSNERTIKLPDGEVTYHANFIEWNDAWNIMYERAWAVAWGYVEYKDIFGTFYTVRHCHFFNFVFDGQKMEVAINKPHLLFAKCNQRTQEEPSDKH